MISFRAECNLFGRRTVDPVFTGDDLKLLSNMDGNAQKREKRFTPSQWRERGQRCLPIYVWNFPERFGDAYTIEVLPISDADGKVSTRSYPTSTTHFTSKS